MHAYTFKCTKCQVELEWLADKRLELGDTTIFLDAPCKCGSTTYERVWSNKGSTGLQGCSMPKENGV